jgi:hypothetical protein
VSSALARPFSNRKKMIYPMFAPPFKFDGFETMTKKQAQQYFDWYISCIPERVKLLEELFANVWQSDVAFDYSMESVYLLWEEFEKHIEVEVKSKKQIMAENQGVPEFLIEELLKDRRYVANNTLVFAMDFAMYLGEVLARNWPGIYWGFFTKPKNMASVNQPVLLGFKYDTYLDPRRIIQTGCGRSIDKKNPSYLRETLEHWSNKLPDK